jgi:hypothetical protein
MYFIIFVKKNKHIVISRPMLPALSTLPPGHDKAGRNYRKKYNANFRN